MHLNEGFPPRGLRDPPRDTNYVAGVRLARRCGVPWQYAHLGAKRLIVLAGHIEVEARRVWRLPSHEDLAHVQVDVGYVNVHRTALDVHHGTLYHGVVADVVVGI